MQRDLCLQGLYLLVITNKQSNILEDLETLRLLSKLVPEYTETLDEEDILTQAFELVSAFDEVISLGHKENISVMQVKQNCEMESHEEKLHKMIIQVRVQPNHACGVSMGRCAARQQSRGGPMGQCTRQRAMTSPVHASMPAAEQNQ